MKQKDIVINFVQAWRNDTLEESYARLDKPTRLHAYSISKSVTSIGVGLAVQEGLLRRELERLAGERGLPLYLPDKSLCGDNAAMIGAQGYYEYLAGNTGDMTLNAYATKSIIGETL